MNFQSVDIETVVQFLLFLLNVLYLSTHDIAYWTFFRFKLL